jgi:chemotaxis protein CheX
MKFREHICQAVEEIFATMIFLDIAVMEGEPCSLGKEDMLSGVIGFAGDLKGTILIHLPAPVAIAITNAFLELDLDEVNSEVKDAIGELANMVAGGFKYHLPENGQNLQLSIPSVISGRGYTCEATGSFSRLVVPFETPAGSFFTEMLIKGTLPAAA